MPATEPPSLTLAAGAKLEEFEILSVIGAGGFGIVYQAFDHSLERRIALKEYMPSQYAYRIDGTTIKPRTSGDIETFEMGLRSFVNEARLLAQFDHRALVKVYRFWEANGTAYMAMPFYEGLTLKQTLERTGAAPDEAWLRSLLDPLLEACATLHAARCFHRDIAPDNIILTSSGPVLLDFGAARRVINDSTRALTVILKEGYAPIEQYGGNTALVQGPWTDIYALCGVLRYAITGHPPPASIERLIADCMEPLSALVAGRYSGGLLRAIDAGLAVNPRDRPQDVAEFRALLDTAPDAITQLRPPESEPAPVPDEAVSDPSPAPPRSGALASPITWLGGAGFGALLLAGAYFLSSPGRFPLLTRPPPASPELGAALAEEQSTETLLERARALVVEHGGSADVVLADALASRSAGVRELKAGDSLSAASDFREAASQTRVSVRSFLEELIGSYSSLAKRKMEAGDLEIAQQAVKKAEALRRAEADFQ